MGNDPFDDVDKTHKKLHNPPATAVSSSSYVYPPGSESSEAVVAAYCDTN